MNSVTTASQCFFNLSGLSPQPQLYIPAALGENISGNTMTRLPLHDKRCLDAAEGWLALGNHLSANKDQA
jgi:hypothetical protein